MARPQRNNVDYFPHLISSGKKMFFIEQKFGNDGYTTWFKLLEKLGETEHHFLNLNDTTELMYLSAKCRVDEERLTQILDDLAKLDAINKELWEVKVVWSDKFIESIQDAYSKRKNKCITIEGLRGKLSSLGILNGSVNTQSIEEETKEKETKEEESKKTSPPLDDLAGLKKEDFLKERKFIEGIIISKSIPEKVLLREYTAFLTDKEMLGGGRIMEEAGEVKKHFLNVINKMIRDGKISFNVATINKKQKKTEPDLTPTREKFEALGGNEKMEQSFINALLANDWNRRDLNTWECIWEHKEYNLQVDLSNK